jgi:hypothetical protein
MWLPFRSSKVTCLDCGLLTLQALTAGGGLRHANAESPTVSVNDRSRIRRRDESLWRVDRCVCRADATNYQDGCNRGDLQDDEGNYIPAPGFARCVLDHIAEPRHCQAFYPLKLGRTPTEHLDARDVDRLRDDNRHWEYWTRIHVGLVIAVVGGGITGGVGAILVPFARAWLESAGWLPKLP